MQIEAPKNIPAAAQTVNNCLSPVNPDCEIAIVIPVYKEFSYGRIAELLKELEGQKIGKRRFETILVINNPSFQQNPTAYGGLMDNLALVEFVKEEKSLGRFDNVHVVNCTNGELPTRHIGLARGLGNEVAWLRLAQTSKGDSGLIVQMDADASVDSDFLLRLQNAFDLTPLAQSAGIPRSPLPVDYDSDDLYLQLARQFFRTVSLIKAGKNPRAFNGSTLSFKAYLHQKPEIRTYLGYSWNEDYRLGGDLFRYSNFIYLSEPRIFVADRKRPEGFDANIRGSFIDLKQPSAQIPVLQEAAQYLQREEELAKGRLNWETVDQNLVQAGIRLYCQGRQLMGKSQVVKAYQE